MEFEDALRKVPIGEVITSMDLAVALEIELGLMVQLSVANCAAANAGGWTRKAPVVDICDPCRMEKLCSLKKVSAPKTSLDIFCNLIFAYNLARF